MDKDLVKASLINDAVCTALACLIALAVLMGPWTAARHHQQNTPPAEYTQTVQHGPSFHAHIAQ